MRFSGAAGSKGNRPIVVSYSSSPVAEVIFRKPRPRAAPTSVIEDSCFRQIEFVGSFAVRGTRRRSTTRRLHALEALPGGHPARDVRLPRQPRGGAPREFVEYAVVPAPLELPPDEIEANRDRWVRVDGHRRSLEGSARWGLTPRGCANRDVRHPARVPRALLRVSPASILERGLRADGSLASPLDVLTDPLTRDVVWFTFWQALASTALTFAVGLPAAYVLGRFAFRGRSVVRALVVVPFVLPTVVVALAFLPCCRPGSSEDGSRS